MRDLKLQHEPTQAAKLRCTFGSKRSSVVSRPDCLSCQIGCSTACQLAFNQSRKEEPSPQFSVSIQATQQFPVLLVRSWAALFSVHFSLSPDFSGTCRLPALPARR